MKLAARDAAVRAARGQPGTAVFNSTPGELMEDPRGLDEISWATDYSIPPPVGRKPAGRRGKRGGGKKKTASAPKTPAKQTKAPVGAPEPASPAAAPPVRATHASLLDDLIARGRAQVGQEDARLGQHAPSPSLGATPAGRISPVALQSPREQQDFMFNALQFLGGLGAGVGAPASKALPAAIRPSPAAEMPAAAAAPRALPASQALPEAWEQIGRGITAEGAGYGGFGGGRPMTFEPRFPSVGQSPASVRSSFPDRGMSGNLADVPQLPSFDRAGLGQDMLGLRAAEPSPSPTMTRAGGAPEPTMSVRPRSAPRPPNVMRGNPSSPADMPDIFSGGVSVEGAPEPIGLEMPGDRFIPSAEYNSLDDWTRLEQLIADVMRGG